MNTDITTVRQEWNQLRSYQQPTPTAHSRSTTPTPMLSTPITTHPTTYPYSIYLTGTANWPRGVEGYYWESIVHWVAMACTVRPLSGRILLRLRMDCCPSRSSPHSLVSVITPHRIRHLHSLNRDSIVVVGSTLLDGRSGCNWVRRPTN